MSIIGKTFQTPRLHGLLFSARCKSDGVGIYDEARLVECPRVDIVDKVPMNHLQ
jgi:hypothetical protein